MPHLQMNASQRKERQAYKSFDQDIRTNGHRYADKSRQIEDAPFPSKLHSETV